MIINSHRLRHANDAGNGYHGYCEHCGAPLVEDLGYCSWDGLKCVDREIVDEWDIPDEIKSYARFKGYRYDQKKRKFVRPSFDVNVDELTIDELNEKIFLIKKDC